MPLSSNSSRRAGPTIEHRDDVRTAPLERTKKRKPELENTPWIPGMVGIREPTVEEALKRFHLQETKHRAGLLRQEIDAANREIHELRVRIGMASKTLSFYAAGDNDQGVSAKIALRAMTADISPNFAISFCKNKAEECAKIAGDLNIPFDIREQYRQLSQEWKFCAEHADMYLLDSATQPT